MSIGSDTYVKTYLRDGDRWLQKRKTRVVRHSNDPQYRQTLRYSACDVLGRSLLVMLWERQKGFEHNQGIGGAEVALDKIQLTHLTTGWYPLFPIHSLGSDSNDSPWHISPLIIVYLITLLVTVRTKMGLYPQLTCTYWYLYIFQFTWKNQTSQIQAIWYSLHDSGELLNETIEHTDGTVYLGLGLLKLRKTEPVLLGWS